MTDSTIYIAGFARSGSTILANVLGQAPNVVHVGELTWLWMRMGRSERNACGCGKPLPQCPKWGAIAREVLARLGRRGDLQAEARALHRLQQRAFHPLALQKVARRATSLPSEARDYLEVQRALYAACRDAFEASTILDSSKRLAPLTYARYSERLLTIHLVRDARACVISRQRRKAPKRDGKVIMRSKTMLADTVRWTVINHRIKRLFGGATDGYLFMRYEDFARDPATQVDRLARAAQSRGIRVGRITDASAVELIENHTVSGNNKVRLARGTVEIRPDVGWKSQIRFADWALTTMVASASLRHFGYAVTDR